MADSTDPPGASTDGLAGHQYRSVRYSIDQLGITIEATREVRGYGEGSLAAADRIGMTGLYREASANVVTTADEAVKALILARGKLEALAHALIEQGA